MADQAEQIGDTGASAPIGTGSTAKRRAVHAMVSIFSVPPEDSGRQIATFCSAVQKVWAEARATGVEWWPPYARLPESRGTSAVDGISQPEVAVAGLDTAPGGGPWSPWPRKRLLA